MNDPAFILFWDTSLVGDEGVTAQLVRFPGVESTAGLILDHPLKIPEPIYFEANTDTLAKVDYVDNDVNWPIISRRMQGVLLTLDAPKHRVIRIAMLDDTVPTAKRFKGGVPRPGVAVEGFGALQLLEQTDAMDMERSSYTPDPDLPGCALDVTKLVLKEMALPPVFRLSAYPSPLLVSRAARNALDNAGIRGIEYRTLSEVL